ncbi:hypothetical protein EJB05_28372, partial [Eragrostis curvula]
MFGLLGAYAAGSTQHMRTSIKIFGLAAAILVVLVLVVLILVIRSANEGADNVENMTPPPDLTMPPNDRHAKKAVHSDQASKPGGVWQHDDNLKGQVAGNPVMHDNARTRYQAFFYINSTSFVASIIVIILLLLKPLHMTKLLSLKAMNTTIMLDLVGLLAAYAIGSARSWKATGYVFVLVFMVLAYIVVHVGLARIIRNAFGVGRDKKAAMTSTSGFLIA